MIRPYVTVHHSRAVSRVSFDQSCGAREFGFIPLEHKCRRIIIAYKKHVFTVLYYGLERNSSLKEWVSLR